MKYKGEEIGIPCAEMIQEFIDECGLSISAEDVIAYWKPKDFLTKRGEPVKTLEALVHVVNSAYVQRIRKTNGVVINKKPSKASRWLDNQFKTFCECMNLLKDENPQKWQEYYEACISLGDKN